MNFTNFTGFAILADLLIPEKFSRIRRFSKIFTLFKTFLKIEIVTDHFGHVASYW